MATVLEATRDIVIKFIEKYPLSSSAYSANIEASVRQLREEVLDFTKAVYTLLAELESQRGTPPLPPLPEEEAGNP
ncbi:MAG: hypothetical protein KatS3mg115_1315 [Candidatus Poribacteria bacterium]|nr:MAG: hypothetical protein KatS3mg115_1315 [Candidatus Poribacteria bacterium]